MGAEVRVHDPQAILEAREVKQDIDYFNDPYEAAEDADTLIILTDWPEYENLDYNRIKETMASASIVDGKNMLDVDCLKELGFSYQGVGRE